MGTFQTFEDIEVWQKARILTYEIYTISSQGQFGKDFGLRNQIRKASVSISPILPKVLKGMAQRSSFNF